MARGPGYQPARVSPCTFVAHREEILNQALDTFRRVRPEARLGHYSGEAKDPDAEVVLASIQTLSRKNISSGSPQTLSPTSSSTNSTMPPPRRTAS